jgi:hypothetical protein
MACAEEAALGTTAEREILEVQARRFQAMIEVDVDALETLFADDLTYIHTIGTIDTKAEMLAALQEDVNYRSIDPRESQVRIYDNVAVNTGIAAMQVSDGDRHLSFSARFTEVYHKSEKGWQLVVWQSTRIPQG